MPSTFRFLITTALMFFSLSSRALPELPPRIIYHYGAKKNLVKDVQAHTIPLNEWNSSVMSDNTKFALRPFRRGLYGAGTEADSIAYGDDEILHAEIPWLIAVHLKKECLTPEATINGLGAISKDPRFKSQDLTGVEVKCAGTGLSGLALYGAMASSNKENVCENFANEFLNKNSIKVVGDDAWEDSWYVRDRNCIEFIDGTAEDILNIMASSTHMWNERSLGDALDDNPDGIPLGASLVAMELESLRSVSYASDKKIFKALKAKIENAEIFDYDQHENRYDWIRESGLPVLTAWRRCSLKGKAAAFNTLASRSLGELLNELSNSGSRPRPVFYAWNRRTSESFEALCK